MKLKRWNILSLAFTLVILFTAATSAIGEEHVYYIDMPDREVAGSSNFNPERVKVKVGDKIIWTNNDSRTHFISSMSNCDYPGSDCYRSPEDEENELEDEEESENSLASDTVYFTSDDIDPGEEFTYTFEKVGVYKYYCFTHPLEMAGFIEVEE